MPHGRGIALGRQPILRGSSMQTDPLHGGRRDGFDLVRRRRRGGDFRPPMARDEAEKLCTLTCIYLQLRYAASSRHQNRACQDILSRRRIFRPPKAAARSTASELALTWRRHLTILLSGFAVCTSRPKSFCILVLLVHFARLSVDILNALGVVGVAVLNDPLDVRIDVI